MNGAPPQKNWWCPLHEEIEKMLCIVNVLVCIYFIIEMIEVDQPCAMGV